MSSLPNWASTAITSADKSNPLKVIEIAKARAPNPSMVSSYAQAIPYLTAPEKTSLGL